MNHENLDAGTIKKIKKMYKRCNIVYATSAKMNNGNSVIAICLVTGFETRDQKTTDVLTSNYWISLNYLDIRDKKIILRFPNESIEFSTTDSQNLFESICDVVQRVLLPKELEDLNFSRFKAYPVYPTPFSVRKRITMIKRDKSYIPNDESERVFDNLLKIGSSTLDLSEFPSLSQLIFQSLPLMTFVKSLIIPKLPDIPVYKILDSLVPSCSFLRHIKVSNTTDSHFPRFLDSIINNKSKVSSIGFGPQSELTIDDLKEIRNRIVNSKIHSLELNSALSSPNGEELSLDFYNLFEGQLGTHLWSLNMNETMKINFKCLIPKLRLITSLSFEDCLIEINEFFSILCQSDMKNLTYLNLNKNDCADKISNELKIPPSLTHISVNDVSWKKNSLVSFFEFFMKQKDEIHLSIAHAGSYREQWDNLFDYLSNSKCTNFRTLVWDRNPVDEKLISFLKQNDKLTYLSMSECFSNLEPMSEKSLILSVADFIKSAQNLKTLVIEGGEVFIGEKFPVIIDACVLHPSLSVLDLSFSKCGNVGLAFLVPLLKRGKLNVQVLNIEGAYCPNQDSNRCLQLFKEIVESASDVHVSFPQKENEELVENKQLKDKQDFQLLFRSNHMYSPEEEKLLNSENEDNYVFKKFKKSPFYIYPLNHYTPEVLFPSFFEDIEHKQISFQASKRQKNAQRDDEDNDSEFIFVNDESEQMKYSEVNQRKLLKTIINDMPSPKSPNAIAINSVALSENESEYSKDQQIDDDSNLTEYSTYTTAAGDQPIVSQRSSPIDKSKKMKIESPSSKQNRTRNSRNTFNNDLQNNEVNNVDVVNDNDNNIENDNKYILSEFNKQKINSFKEKYEIKRSVPFPKIEYPNQIMDEKWNQIDNSYSLEALYSMLKNQKNSVSKK